MPNGHGITEGHPFQNGGIFRLFPEGFKGYGQRRCCRTQWIVLEVVIGIGAESIYGDRVLLIEILGEIPDEGFPLHQGGIADRQKHFRQRDRCFCAVLCRYNRIRQKVGINIGVFIVMLQIREVLAVFNDHTRVLASALMVDDMEVVPLVFATPQVQKRTRHTAQAGTDTLGLRNRECLCCRIVGLAGEVMRRSGVLKNTLHRK